MRPHDLLVRASLERRTPGEALIEHAPERVLVGGAEHGLLLDLLLVQHVEWECAEDRPRHGQSGPSAHVLRDAEVSQVHMLRV